MKLNPADLLHHLASLLMKVSRSHIWEARDRKIMQDMNRQILHLARRAEHRQQVVTNDR